MTNLTAALQQHLIALLAEAPDRGALLREISLLAREPGFGSLATIWAPALYARDPIFFEAFLARYLDGGRHAQVIKELLPKIEAAGQDSLYQELYRKVAREEVWNADLRALAQLPGSDEALWHAVQRRTFRSSWLRLEESTALVLYRRNPELFGPFISSHIRRSWSLTGAQFKQLRHEAIQRGDNDLSWALFREFAHANEWKAELQKLLREHLPAGRIVEELKKRHPRWFWEADPDVLLDFLEHYGLAVLPYIEEHLSWISRRSSRRLLAGVARLGDQALYWQIFFNVGDRKQWNDALRDLLRLPLPDEALLLAVQQRTPDQSTWRWQLDPDVALALYQRQPIVLRPFLERFLEAPDLALFRAAEGAQDEEFLDALSFRMLKQLFSLVWRISAAGNRSSHRRDKERQELEEIARLLVTRCDRLYARSPELYVRHAANIMSRFEPFEIWDFQSNRQHNPAFVYLSERHHASWLACPDSMRELLESPNMYVQLIGLEMLNCDSLAAAQRVVENLVHLRALLLGRARINTKKLVLACLERAARQGAAFADLILPVLEETLDFRGSRAIDQRVMVSFVRLCRELRREVALCR